MIYYDMLSGTIYVFRYKISKLSYVSSMNACHKKVTGTVKSSIFDSTVLEEVLRSGGRNMIEQLCKIIMRVINRN